MRRFSFLLGLAACVADSPPAAGVRIHDVQGSAQVSPLAGQVVHDLPGVITAIGPHGLWLQDPAPDGDPATSEGLFVHLDPPRAEAGPLAPGDELRVDGRVLEYVPPRRAGQLPVTELDEVRVRLIGHGRPLPAATRVGRGGRRPPTEVICDDAPGGDALASAFDPEHDGLDFWESLEGMLVEVADPVACSPSSSLDELWVLADGGADAPGRNARGGVTLRPGAPNPERLLLSPLLVRPPRVDVGTRLAQDGAPLVRGVLDYAFGNFRLLPVAPVQAAGGGVSAESVPPAGADELSVACFNLANFCAAQDRARLAPLARIIASNLAAPDLLAVEEMQDDSGSKNDGTLGSERNAAALLDAIVAAGGPRYRYADVAPRDGADGGQPGGNIRCGLLWREDRGLSLLAPPQLVAPEDPCFRDSRKPLAAELAWRGAALTVVACHFTSKSGDDELAGARQPPQRPSEARRVAQAAAVRRWLDGRGAARVLVLGDLNDAWFEEATAALGQDGALVDLVDRLPEAERYTYVWQGNSEQLDHVLASPTLAAQCRLARPVHVASEFAQQASDHDPVLARFSSPP